MAAGINLAGLHFGRLTVMRRAGRSGNGRVNWLCVCDCGTRKVVRGDSLQSGNTLSCGCLARESSAASARRINYRHGHTVGGNSSEYRSWQMMKERCYNPAATSYHNYGGRGIAVCERWLNSFENFYADMGPKPSLQHSIDRINNDKPTDGYSPENCRWATRSEQLANRRPYHKREACHQGEVTA